MSDPASQELTAWTALSRAYQRGRAHIDSALKSAGLPALDVYDALVALDGDGIGGGMTASMLEERLEMPQYAVSRLMDRMEKLSVIERKPNPGDKRSKLIRITDEGRRMRMDMAQAYGAAISGFLGARAKPGQLERMADLLGLLDREPED